MGNFWQGKKVFITGGSSGIGKEAAKIVAGLGADVGIAARGQERLDEALAEIKQVRDGQHAAFSIDVSDRDDVNQAVPDILGALGGLDVLINNAGIAHPAHVGDTPDEVFDSMMDVNYFGMVNVTRAFLPHLRQQKSGNICNVSSLLGFMGIYGYTAYAASKFAMTGFSDCLRQDLMGDNIEIHVLFPPDTDTPQWHAENEIKPEATKAIAGNVKVMKPETVAQVMIDGIAAGKYHIVPGLMSKFTYFMYRHFPWMVRYVIDSDLKKYLKKQRS